MVVAQVVAHRTSDREVLSQFLLGAWLFFLSSLSYLSVSGASLISVPGGGATLLIFQLSKEKMEGLAVQLDAKLNTH